MTKQTFGSEIIEVNGIKKLKMSSTDYFQTRIQKLSVGKYTVTLSDTKPRRSTNQNNYYWLYLGIIEEETGNLASDIHEYAKRKFLPPRFITVKGETIKVPGSTTKLTKTEFGEYLDKISAWSGITLPNPEDAGYYVETGKIEKPLDIDYPENNLGEQKF